MDGYNVLYRLEKDKNRVCILLYIRKDAPSTLKEYAKEDQRIYLVFLMHELKMHRLKYFVLVIFSEV